jgi:lipopolysaccharide/colanic/teichoic acid biosynthesis glycosyltransferase
LLPLGPFIALFIKLDSKGPLLYLQKRVGKNECIFSVIKFRTMYQNAENGQAVWAKEKDERVTRVGKILRKFRLDEITQFINVLKGDMALIGPRPERPEFVSMLSKEIPFYNYRHLVKPGITGWAQVNYSYGNSVEDALEKLQYDLYWIKNRSFWLDLKVILKSIKVVLTGFGAM